MEGKCKKKTIALFIVCDWLFFASAEHTGANGQSCLILWKQLKAEKYIDQCSWHETFYTFLCEKVFKFILLDYNLVLDHTCIGFLLYYMEIKIH